MSVQSLPSDSQELSSYFNPSSFITHGANSFSQMKVPLSHPNSICCPISGQATGPQGLELLLSKEPRLTDHLESGRSHRSYLDETKLGEERETGLRTTHFLQGTARKENPKLVF